MPTGIEPQALALTQPLDELITCGQRELPTSAGRRGDPLFHYGSVPPAPKVFFGPFPHDSLVQFPMPAVSVDLWHRLHFNRSHDELAEDLPNPDRIAPKDLSPGGKGWSKLPNGPGHIELPQGGPEPPPLRSPHPAVPVPPPRP